MFSTHYRKADAGTRERGREWYGEARAFCTEQGEAHGVPAHVVAGIVAAISPRISWKANKRCARLCLARIDSPAGVLRANYRKACEIRDGAEPLAVLGGDKVRAFYRAICGDHHAVVLDAHMLRAARFKKPKTTPREYARIAARLRAEARQHGERPAAFQAIVWCHIRGKAE